jgi:ADP-dependent NAD(P)H-hydrate dehydratase / NAD(P)H-hydrate epimerase
MIPILTPTESAALDDAAAARGVTVDDLMERAGRAVARTALRVAGGGYGRRAVVVCGKGNNGGDGLVAARHMARWGMGVSVVLLADAGSLLGAAGSTFARFAATGGRWKPFETEFLRRELDRSDVAVDAIFGTGFRGAPEGDFAAAIDSLGDGPPVVAVDIPSGVEGETGAVRAGAVWAAVTVTLGALKPGVVFHPGAEHAGDVEVADIGFPPELVRSDLSLVEAADVATLLGPREPDTTKRRVGVVLVLAGSRTMTGAAVLAARAATRAGAGLVTLAVPQGILPVVEAGLVEGTFLALPETEAGTVSEEAWPVLEERLAGVTAAAVGPGLTTSPATSQLVRRFVRECPIPLVLDADGLNAFAGRSPELADRKAEAVLTPHAGEFGRLTGLSAEEVAQDRVGHARKAAAEFRCAVLLKGSRTVVAEPDGRAVVNPTGGPYLASGGTGDVLTGTIAALLARGLRPSDAAMAGAYVHGLAGRLAAEATGEGVVASDLLPTLPRAMALVEEAG